MASTRQRGPELAQGREERAAETAAAPARQGPIMPGSTGRSSARGIAWIGGLRWLSQLVTWSVALVVARLIQPAAYGFVCHGSRLHRVRPARQPAGTRHRAGPATRPGRGRDRGARWSDSTSQDLAFVRCRSWGRRWVAHFFRQPTLRAVIAVLSATFVIRGFQVVPRAILARELNFRVLAWINTLESGVWSATTVVGALLGLGYWALVAGALTSALIPPWSDALRWLRPHRLAWPSNLSAPFARTLTTPRVVHRRRPAQLVHIRPRGFDARRPGPRSSLARCAYSWASNIADVPVDRVSTLVGQVTPAVFAAAQTELDVLRRHVLGLTEALAIVHVSDRCGAGAHGRRLRRCGARGRVAARHRTAPAARAVGRVSGRLQPPAADAHRHGAREVECAIQCANGHRSDGRLGHRCPLGLDRRRGGVDRRGSAHCRPNLLPEHAADSRGPLHDLLEGALARHEWGGVGGRGGDRVAPAAPVELVGERGVGELCRHWGPTSTSPSFASVTNPARERLPRPSGTYVMSPASGSDRWTSGVHRGGDVSRAAFGTAGCAARGRERRRALTMRVYLGLGTWV